MYLLGSLITLSSALFNSLRYSTVKDLSRFRVSPASVDFYYRIVSLPFVTLVFLLSRESFFASKEGFIFWFVVALVVNVGFGLYHVYTFQKHGFSVVESLSFLDILFTSIAGLFLFGEVLTSKQTLGLSIIVAAFIFLAFSVAGKAPVSLREVVSYYLFVATVNLANKQAILYSSPLIYVVSLTLALIVTNGLIAIKEREPVYRLQSRGANRLLFFLGLLASLAFITNSYGYQLLPVGIVSALISSKTFISLWISHQKYGEKELRSKVVASVVATFSILVLVL